MIEKKRNNNINKQTHQQTNKNTNNIYSYEE